MFFCLCSFQQSCMEIINLQPENYQYFICLFRTKYVYLQQFLFTPCSGCGGRGLLHLLESVTNALSYGSETTTIRRMPKIKVRSECYGYVIILHVRGVLREYPLLSDAHFPENDEYIHTTWVIILFVGMQGCGRPQRQISRGGYSRFSLCRYDTSIIINRLGRVPEAQRERRI